MFKKKERVSFKGHLILRLINFKKEELMQQILSNLRLLVIVLYHLLSWPLEKNSVTSKDLMMQRLIKFIKLQES